MDKDILKTAVVLRHRLHRCAELSGQEKQTKAMLIDFLRTHTSLELHDMGAWFYAVSTEEHLSISSAKRMYEYILNVIACK